MIPDDQAWVVCESQALNAVYTWVMNRRGVNAIEGLVEMIRDAQPDPAVG